MSQARKFRGRLASTISQINQKDMDKSVAKGILWQKSTLDFVPTAAVAKIDEDCWQSFVGYDVFSWKLEKMMWAGWKPRCVSCFSATEVRMHSRDQEPRLVYGIKANYILHSPEQWLCEAYKHKNSSEKACNIKASKRTQYTFQAIILLCSISLQKSILVFGHFFLVSWAGGWPLTMIS